MVNFRSVKLLGNKKAKRKKYRFLLSNPEKRACHKIPGKRKKMQDLNLGEYTSLFPASSLCFSSTFQSCYFRPFLLCSFPLFYAPFFMAQRENCHIGKFCLFFVMLSLEEKKNFTTCSKGKKRTKVGKIENKR